MTLFLEQVYRYRVGIDICFFFCRTTENISFTCIGRLWETVKTHRQVKINLEVFVRKRISLCCCFRTKFSD